VTGDSVSGSDMPSLPWTARRDVSPAEETSLEALLAGSGLPAGADPELRPVADLLAALSAGRPANDELTGLAAAREEFHRQVVLPAQAAQAPRRRLRLASRLGVKVGAAAALVAMALGGAAAAAYADVLPVSWQQFAHRTIGAPAYRAHHAKPTGAGAAEPTVGRPPVPHPGHPAHHKKLRRPPAWPGLVHHPGPLRHAKVPAVVPTPAVPPFAHHGGVSAAHPAHSDIVRPARVGADRRPLHGHE
jgi:hypothetical protein